ncbi:hypothetical protein MRX98_00490 [Desulfatitalea sp. M08but]|uniref:6-phosphogluconate dehydrogenase C-terminal domain-containing protein n=1 Tax=Desulfatitalea alkaliphila TaxID=2929485 RepID=A0AA41UMY9_9BACT|nr:hypothetical protein [Desulfatitalea alkaliphila]
MEHLRDGYYAAAVITYAQGMALLRKASPIYGNQLDPATVARIWRGGCIIRAVILETIQAAYERDSNLTDLLLDPSLNALVQIHLPALREVVRAGVDLGIPLPGMMAALAHFDAYRSERLPANLIMAQRDYFGAHGYERKDAQGIFHAHWSGQ